MVGPWRNLTFDSCLISHKIELVQTLGEHVCPKVRKDFTQLRIWEIKVSGNNPTPDSSHGRSICLILLVEDLTIVFVQNLSRGLVLCLV
jgi:hypothetical protein